MNHDQPLSDAEIKERRNQEIISLAAELSERSETFPFPGIDPNAYQKIKAKEEEYPGYTTSIDEFTSRCKAEGIKVILGTHPNNIGQVFILPAQSSDLVNDGVFPGNLALVNTMDQRLKKLVHLDRERLPHFN